MFLRVPMPASFQARQRLLPGGMGIALAVLVAGGVAYGKPGKSSAASLTFEQDIRPILKTHCFQCHGEGEKLKGGLDLRLRRLIEKGGETGPALVPGRRDQSLIYDLIHKGEMPKSERKLSAQEVELIGRWIAEGARTARPEPAEIARGFQLTEEERSFWAFQPIRHPAIPKVKHRELVNTPIDAFLLQRLEDKKLSFSPAADPLTLLRRATFDLTGLPPTPEEVDRFLADHSPDAYEKLIDRLLASPHYGERWGRHWLDVAGYADSEGYTESDPVRNYAHKYRDYVIRSFNDDKPFDLFIQEQVAGDEMVPQPYKDLKPDAVEKLVATGFLRMAPDGTGGGAADQNLARNQVVADTLQIVSTSLLGLTVACAQCHDHRYDPISQEDYYRLRAIFEPGYDWKNWRTPQNRLISLATDADRARAKEIEAEAVKIDQERAKKQEEYIERTFQKELAKLPEDLREPVRTARNTTAAKRTAAQKQLLKEHPSVNVSAGSLYLYDPKAADELKACAERAAQVRATKPKEDFIRAMTELHGKVPVTYLFNRGDYEQPKQPEKPAELTVLASVTGTVIPEQNPALPTTGRRLAYARSLTNGKHPLTARVLVNRVWAHHFGRGIVSTVGNFGRLGERPTHPELLDWLASDFMAQGWKLKRLQKMILMSTAYQQVSRRTPKLDEIDPDNRLYARMSIRRLEAEGIRDCTLAVSGKLINEMSGPPVPVKEDEVGQFVIGIENKDGEGKPGKEIPLHGQEYRRSVYVQMRRTRPLGVLETFDAPTMSPNCESRSSSTVATQSLMLMNSSFTLEQARFFAERVRREAGGDPGAEVARAWKLAFGAEPTPAELKAAVAFVDGQAAEFAAAPAPAKSAKDKSASPAGPPDPQLKALASFCHALLSANRFLYID